MIYLKTIKETICNELIIKNSRFITYLFKINSVDEEFCELGETIAEMEVTAEDLEEGGSFVEIYCIRYIDFQI